MRQTVGYVVVTEKGEPLDLVGGILYIGRPLVLFTTLKAAQRAVARVTS